MYITCVFDDDWFVGNIVETSLENKDILVKFMKRSVSAKTFTWPDKDDICWVPVTHILCRIESLNVQSGGGRCYGISLKELNDTLRSFENFRP